MRQFASSAGSLVLFAGLAVAQQLVVPDTSNFANAGTSTAVWRTTSGRVQMIHDASHFVNADPITINRLRWRAEDSERNLSGQVYAERRRVGGRAAPYAGRHARLRRRHGVAAFEQCAEAVAWPAVTGQPRRITARAGSTPGC